ncbi:uncharacterized protein RHIMIDRAFT_269154 [Rhizopus microsporus ATCC 52813]|uniref:Uncharacterized protein n=1 Tax=Rhizopus microsporus ATCC 52813 TaxID=1340429 RepID=A0A2G4SHX0_RHIZD|nr:uncharacterized protein RHIMIDRAFT_269154 [Rhizopus microsporus ATCC 52813]PHZ08365.1 hypothetical protein RHIMIDRAFT_269154 [Rhizopus microsporus ATCC 52813]
MTDHVSRSTAEKIKYDYFEPSRSILPVVKLIMGLEAAEECTQYLKELEQCLKDDIKLCDYSCRVAVQKLEK